MKEANSDDLFRLVGEISEKISQIPQGAEILQKAVRGEISQETAVEEIFSLLLKASSSDGSGLLEEIRVASSGALAPLVGEEPSLLVRDSSNKEVINPLWEAALAERLSLDGDAPEFRFGPLPEGAKPAPYVFLQTLNPVVAGFMLERASQKVLGLIQEERKEHKRVCERVLEETERKSIASGSDLEVSLQTARKFLPEAPLGVPGYLAGKIPDFWVVDPPEGKDLLLLSKEESQRYSYQALATTQGRVSISRVLEAELVQRLQNSGIQVSQGKPSGKIILQKAWASVVYGEKDLSEDFNYIEVVLNEFLNEILQKASSGKEYLLEVKPYNGVYTRTFGWEIIFGGIN
jgi:hypothetical protein